jgi:hypothetical protein
MMAEKISDAESPKQQENHPKKRRAHDILWLILFILIQIGMIVVLVLTSKYGSVDRYDVFIESRLRYGTDSLGNYCG